MGERFSLYLVKPEVVSDFWEAQDPNDFAKSLVLAHADEVSEATGEDWRTWDETQDRFENDELKWIADFVVRNLVFVKSDLGIETPEAISHVMQVMWKTLDLLNADASDNIATATQERYTQLRNGLRRLFEEKFINKDQVSRILDYMRKTIFGHMQLYLTCLGQKKQATRIKRVAIFTEVPQCAEVGDLESNCREVLDEGGRSATPESIRAGETAVGDN